MLTKLMAYALNIEEGLEFSPQGLADPDAPALRAADLNGNTRLWIEVGNPSPKKLHKAAKVADRVRVYTYKDPQSLVRNLSAEKIHKSDEIEIYSFDPKFLSAVEKQLERDNKWSILYQDKNLTLNIGDASHTTEIGTWAIAEV